MDYDEQQEIALKERNATAALASTRPKKASRRAKPKAKPKRKARR